MMVAMRRRSVTLTLAALAAAALPAFAVGATGRAVGTCSRSTVAPKTIVLTCALSDTDYIAHVKWTSFGGRSASGSGAFRANTCSPSCAAGRFRGYRVTLTATAPKPCPDHHDDYRRLSVTFIGSPPKSYGKHYSTELHCPMP